MYRSTREKELVAQRDRSRATRGGRQAASEMAEELWDEQEPRLDLQEFPTDFVRNLRRTEVIDLPEGDVEVGEAMIPTGRHLAAGTIRVGGPDGPIIEVGTIGRARYLEAMAESGHYGAVHVPTEEMAASAIDEFERYKTGLHHRFEDLARSRTRVAKRQIQIVDALMRRALRWRRDRQGA